MLKMLLLYYPSYYYHHLFLVFIIQVSYSVDCLPFFDEISNISEYHSIASCVVKIGKMELAWRPAIALNIGENETEKALYMFDEIVRQSTRNKIPFTVIDTTDNNTVNTETANYMMISYLEDCKAMTEVDFEHIDEDIKYLFILESYSDCSQYVKHLGNIIGKYDISTFVENPKGDWDLYTYIPIIDDDTCEVVIKKPLKINTCSKGKLSGYVAFPSKITTNLKKCPFKVGIGSLYPFGIVENKEAFETNDVLDIDSVKGVDIEIIKIMTHQFNATLYLYYILKHEENPYINLDYLPLLLNGSLEVCAGGLYRIYGDAVDYSGVYASQTVTWIYSAERITMTWEAMATNIDGLYIFIIFYVIYSISLYFIRTFDNHAVTFQNTLLYSWGALVGTTSLQHAKSMKEKILNVVYLIMCLHLAVYINIQLYSFFTIQNPPEMFKTNEDIMKSGRTPFLKSLSKYFIDDEKYLEFANTSSECEGFKECGEVSLLKKGVTLFISGYFYQFQAETTVNDEARMLRPVENLLTVYYEMIIRKESPLVLKFQKTTVRLFEAGITEKLYQEAIGLTVIGLANTASRNMMTSSYACETGCRLNLNHFYGIFYVWGFGCFMSLCIFTLEFLANNPVKLFE